tara:strand:+ start:372 stop:977 length:606 start_codon:yes stop_codon:yes gene_type:complete
MPKRAFKLYQRKRVVNINLNILAAGFLAIALAKIPIMLIGNWIGTEHKFLIAAIAYVVDTIFDVIVYYALHWIANHWNPHGHLPEQKKRPKSRRFVHDATRIQAERMALVPIFILIGPVGMWVLDRFYGIQHSWAFVIAFVCAIITTRIIHTFWGYRSGTFKDTVDFMIDDDIQIGRDLSKEAEEREQEVAVSEETDEVTL